MDFLNKIKAGAAEVGKQAQIKIEVTRLKSLLSEKQQAVEAKYRDIGQKIYQVYRSAPGQDFPGGVKEICLQIQGLEAEMEEIKEKINELKGVKLCPACHREIDYSARFCPNCGANVEQASALEAAEKEANQKVCPQCGKTAKKEAKFCTGCGQMLPQE